jgi:hypothetical protein
MESHRGPVAQLGARFHGMEEVVGSIPTRSTNFNNLQLSPPPVFKNNRLDESERCGVAILICLAATLAKQRPVDS